LQVAPLRDVAEWADSYRRFWDASYDRLDEYLQTLEERERTDGNEE
jgi:hypothetical protein